MLRGVVGGGVWGSQERCSWEHPILPEVEGIKKSFHPEKGRKVIWIFFSFAID